MSVKTILFGLFISLAFLTDLLVGTTRYPNVLIFVCAIVAVYEFVSPYVYTPR